MLEKIHRAGEMQAIGSGTRIYRMSAEPRDGLFLILTRAAHHVGVLTYDGKRQKTLRLTKVRKGTFCRDVQQELLELMERLKMERNRDWNCRPGRLTETL